MIKMPNTELSGSILEHKYTNTHKTLKMYLITPFSLQSRIYRNIHRHFGEIFSITVYSIIAKLCLIVKHFQNP